jgi:hypothetical protein
MISSNLQISPMVFLPVAKSSLLLPLIFHLSGCSATETEYTARSPAESISAYFWISNGRNTYYRVNFFSQWDETRFVDGYLGKLVVIARRCGDTWYLAGRNGEGNEKRLNVELAFLGRTRTGKLISDGADNRSFSMHTINITQEKPLEVKLKGNGGFVVAFGN